MSLDIVWLRENIITIINLRNITEVLSLNILDIPTPPAQSPLPFRVNSTKNMASVSNDDLKKRVLALVSIDD